MLCILKQVQIAPYAYFPAYSASLQAVLMQSCLAARAWLLFLRFYLVDEGRMKGSKLEFMKLSSWFTSVLCISMLFFAIFASMERALLP